jgi:hypothetical protein
VRVAKLVPTVALVAAVLPLAACAAPPQAEARVVVRIAGAAHPADYEVHLVRADGAFRTVQRMRSGETHEFSVPTGWLTVRIPGLCVVPTAATGTSTVDVRPNDCRVD